MPFHWFLLPCWIPLFSAPDSPHWHLMGDCNCADGKIRTELFLHSQRPWIKHYGFAWCPFMFCMRLTRGLGNCTAWTRIDCGFYHIVFLLLDLSWPLWKLQFAGWQYGGDLPLGTDQILTCKSSLLRTPQRSIQCLTNHEYLNTKWWKRTKWRKRTA